MNISVTTTSRRGIAGACGKARDAQGTLTFSAAIAIALGLAMILAVVSLSALAGTVTAVDPHTGHRAGLPDNHRDSWPDYVPQRFDVHVVPGLAQPREESRARSSGGGSICHGSDGGTTISTASRSCDTDAPAGDGGRDTHAGSAASTR